MYFLHFHLCPSHLVFHGPPLVWPVTEWSPDSAIRETSIDTLAPPSLPEITLPRSLTLLSWSFGSPCFFLTEDQSEDLHWCSLVCYLQVDGRGIYTRLWSIFFLREMDNRPIFFLHEMDSVLHTALAFQHAHSLHLYDLGGQRRTPHKMLTPHYMLILLLPQVRNICDQRPETSKPKKPLWRNWLTTGSEVPRLWKATQISHLHFYNFNCPLIYFKDFLFIFRVSLSLFFSTKLCLSCTIPKATLHYSCQFHIWQQVPEYFQTLHGKCSKLRCQRWSVENTSACAKEEYSEVKEPFGSINKVDNKQFQSWHLVKKDNPYSLNQNNKHEF